MPDPRLDSELSPAARRRLLDVAARVLPSLAATEVPASLVRVRGFAPGRRASAGAVPLAAALERDEGFRLKVAQALREVDPELAAAVERPVDAAAVDAADSDAADSDGGGADDAAAVDAGVTGLPAGHDPVDVAVAAYLLRPDGWPALVHAAHDAEHERHAAAAADEVRALADRLGADLAAARAELQAVRSEAAQAQQQAADELAGVRRELRRHRSDADRARAEGRAALAEAADLQAEATAAAETADERVRRADREVAEAVEALQGLRRAGREGRSLAGSRARLLLDTLVDAATGLRHELALPPADVLPADVVAGSLAEPVEEQPGTPARARAQDDPAILDELLSLPRAHLVVDGYNVTKSAYGTLPLVDQRRRLLVGLSALAARTRVEVTCVFDGTTIEGRVAAPSARGVRVMFSEAGEIADELIRRLVRAEPPGRVVVVVSSDREVADGVRASGARPVPSASLARLLDRG